VLRLLRSEREKGPAGKTAAERIGGVTEVEGAR